VGDCVRIARRARRPLLVTSDGYNATTPSEQLGVRSESELVDADEAVTAGGAGDEPLTVGFLHLGSERSGIHQDGRMLATRLRERPGVRVVECAVDVTDAGLAGLRKLMRAARALAVADVTIVPYSPNRLWAPGRTHLVQLALTLLAVSRTVTVVHDVYPSRPWRSRNWWALATCALLSRAVVFHEQHELATLETVPRRGRLFRIPLPVEAMSLPPRSGARAQLGVGEASAVLGMVGWIHPRKNCERAVQVLARLPEDAQLWLIGSATPDAKSYCRRLKQLAGDLGVADRLSITGYVSDDELRCRLAATDVALVPYTAISASASLSTLIGARRPVLASDLTVTRELHELAPDAIRLGDDPGVIAELVESVLADPPGETAFAPLLRARSPEAVTDCFERLCREVSRRVRCPGGHPEPRLA
jgi:glycosyltransferase involved in cell wall biosynthesis